MKTCPNHTQGLLLTLLIFCAGAMQSSTADVYKWVDEKGTVHFTDDPAASNQAEKIEVKPITTMPFPKQAPARPQRKEKPKASYSAANIITPANNSAFYNNEGAVNVSFRASPPIQPGHHYVLTIDNKEISLGQQQEYQLNHVERGTHSIRVDIHDAQGKIFQGSPSQFTLHKHTNRPTPKAP